MKRSYDGDYSFWAANLVKKLTKPNAAHSVECLCEVDEYSVKRLILQYTLPIASVVRRFKMTLAKIYQKTQSTGARLAT